MRIETDSGITGARERQGDEARRIPSAGRPAAFLLLATVLTSPARVSYRRRLPARRLPRSVATAVTRDAHRNGLLYHRCAGSDRAMRLAESRRRDALRRFSGWQRCGRPPLA